MDGKSAEAPTKIDFTCSKCQLSEKVDYHGCTPPFSKSTTLKFPSYIMKDPFSPPGSGEVLVIGSDCSVCGVSVCIGKECSLFYLKTFCVDCVAKNINCFPKEIKTKLAAIVK